MSDPNILPAVEWLRQQKSHDKTRAQLRLTKDRFWDFVDRWKRGEEFCPEFEKEIKSLLDDDQF